MKIDRRFVGRTFLKLSRVGMGICWLMLIAGGAMAQEVRVDFDKSADFSKYKTFGLVSGTPAENPLVHQRILAGIEAQLTAKGLRRTQSNPDIIVAYHAATDTQVSINALGGGPLGGWRWGSGTATVDKALVGQLVVDIGDVGTRKFVWRGTASGTVSSKAEKNEKALNSALTKMFQNFPNPPGKNK